MLLATYLLPASAHAFDLSAGLAAIEEGDDRLRPGAALHVGLNQDYFMRGYLYGRTYGPVTERTSLASANYRFGFWGSAKDKGFLGALGVATLMEETTVKADPEGKEDDTVAKQFNLGMSFGASYRWLFGSLETSVNWDSHVFLAGSAGIFLSTGRKQAISLLTGIQF